MRKADKTIISLLVALVVLLATSPVLPNWFSFLIAISLAEGLVTLGLVVLKRAGLISFGQGLYYCLGGYAVGIIGQYGGISNALALILCALVVGGLVSALVGLLLCRYRDIFFAMLTLAFSMILYGVLANTASLGSTDGFGVVPIGFFGWHPASQRLGLVVYLLICVLAVGSAMLLHRYFSAGMGWAGEAIRENEIRVEYLGISPQKILYFKYIVAAMLAALGGALAAFASGHVDPKMAYWTTSGDFVFMMLLGGSANVAAPFIGAFIFELIRTFAFDYVPYTWHMILGFVLLLIILFQPNGLWALFSNLLSKKKVRVV
jgi:ABC-type branched-subunit amino acid transport system permease subunit